MTMSKTFFGLGVWTADLATLAATVVFALKHPSLVAATAEVVVVLVAVAVAVAVVVPDDADNKGAEPGSKTFKASSTSGQKSMSSCHPKALVPSIRCIVLSVMFLSRRRGGYGSVALSTGWCLPSSVN